MSDMSKNHDIKNGTNDSNNKSLSMDLNFPDDQSLYSGVDNIMDSIQLPPPEYFNNDDTLRTWNPMVRFYSNTVLLFVYIFEGATMGKFVCSYRGSCRSAFSRF